MGLSLNIVSFCHSTCSNPSESVKFPQKKERFVLLKGTSLFVFAAEDDPAPKYAIEIAYMKAVMADESTGQTVFLETSLGDVEYKFHFRDSKTAKQFKVVISREAATAESDIARKVRIPEHSLYSAHFTVILIPHNFVAMTFG